MKRTILWSAVFCIWSLVGFVACSTDSDKNSKPEQKPVAVAKEVNYDQYYRDSKSQMRPGKKYKRKCSKKKGKPKKAMPTCQPKTSGAYPLVKKELKDMDCVGGIPEQPRGFNTEQYDSAKHTPFKQVARAPLSTFSADVDTASYANFRRFINNGQLPPAGAVRVEEMLNYFSYDYPRPAKTDKHPFKASIEIASCPWAPKHRLARVGIATNPLYDPQKRPDANIVFLLDVSGSMSSQNKLPLVQKSMRLLLETLKPTDRVAVVVYAGADRVVLESTPVKEGKKILKAINNLYSGGSTNGAAGIKRAYQIAEANKVKGGVNRIILCTDGDFNVGTTSRSALVKLAAAKAKHTGVFLTILGFGMGNYKDATMEELSNKANGTSAYIDTEKEARKVLVREVSATLMVVAKDVKFQIEFNPAKVAGYRLIGYENRRLADKDFNDDTKDAGEVGAGHSVTALYEIIPAGMKVPGSIDKLKYQKVKATDEANDSNESFTLKIRYKKPDGKKSTLITIPVEDAGKKIATASRDFKFAAGVAAAGMLLSDSKFVGNYTLRAAHELALPNLGEDRFEYRKEFAELIKNAAKMREQKKAAEKAAMPAKAIAS